MADEKEIPESENLWDDDTDQSLDARLSRGEEVETTVAEAEAKALLAWKAEKERADDAERRLFEAQLKEAESLSPDYQPPREDSTIEQAAVAAAAMDPAELMAFSDSLKAANEDLIRRARAGTEGFDDSGQPIFTEPPFDPSTLDGDGFSIFMAAAARGAADPRRTRPGTRRRSGRRPLTRPSECLDEPAWPRVRREGPYLPVRRVCVLCVEPAASRGHRSRLRQRYWRSGAGQGQGVPARGRVPCRPRAAPAKGGAPWLASPAVRAA